MQEPSISHSNPSSYSNPSASLSTESKSASRGKNKRRIVQNSSGRDVVTESAVETNVAHPPIASSGLGTITGGVGTGFIESGLLGLGYVSSVLFTSDSPQKRPSKKPQEPDQGIKDKRLTKDHYELVKTSKQDKRKVIEFYQHYPVPGYEIASIRMIHNPDINRNFDLYMEELQQRNNNPAFEAKWSTGQENADEPVEPMENTEWRHVVNEQLQALAKQYRNSHYPAVNLVPMWYGAKKETLESIFRTGYANVEMTNIGLFGKGIYNAHEPEYAYQVHAKKGGALIINWVASFSAYPVIAGDLPKFEGKKNYANYDAHFIPVVPRNPDNRNEKIYYPTKPFDGHQYIELVVFKPAACLPRYLVELQRTLKKSVPLNKGHYRGVFFPPTLVGEESKNSQQEKTEESPSSRLARLL